MKLKSRGSEVISFIEKFCCHTIGEKSNTPLFLDEWQKEFINEAYLMRWNGSKWIYVYQNIILGVPRGAGKSTLGAALSLFELSPFSFENAPRVLLAAASRNNTKQIYDPARDMVFMRQPQFDTLGIEANKNVIICRRNRGELTRLSADGKGQFGHLASFALKDELHTFETDKQVELNEAINTGLSKRVNARSMATTTAGHNKSGILGKTYDEAIKNELLEHPAPALSVVKDRENSFLFWWYEAPANMPVNDPATWKAAHPASWIDEDQIRAQVNDPSVSEDEFRRNWLNQWTKSHNAWFQVGVWRKLKSDDQIPKKERIQIAVDGSWSNDTTAVVWAYAKDEDSPVLVRSHVWAVRQELEHDTFVPGGTMDMDLVREFIKGLAEKYQITEIVYDPRFFDMTAKQLSRDGFTIASFEQQSPQMTDAIILFERLVLAGEVHHDGNPVLTDHVESTATVETERGPKIMKLKQTRKIDSTVAAVMAVARAKADLSKRNVSYVFRKTDKGIQHA